MSPYCPSLDLILGSEMIKNNSEPCLNNLCSVCALHWGLCNALRGVQCIQGISSVHWELLSVLGDIISTLRVVQYIEGCS